MIQSDKQFSGHILYATNIGLISLVILSFVLLSASSATATTTSATATVRINSACSLSSNVDTPHTTTLSNGSYSGASGYGQTTFKAFCNDAGGFSIYAIGYTGNEYANTTMHWNKATSSSDNTNAIPTEVYSAGNMSNSSWSMKLASSGGTYAATVVNGTNNEEDFTSWHVIPENYTKVAYRTSGTDAYVDTNSIGSSVTLTYDTYIIATQPAGNYTGQVKFTLMHPSSMGSPSYELKPSDCLAYSICYAPNANDIIGDMSSLGTIAASSIAGKQTLNSQVTSARLIAPNYARAGYGFAGWSTDYVADDSSTIYGPNETIAITASSLATNGMILYPVWIASAGNMQEWNGCSGLTAATYNSTTGKVSATLNQLTALTDARDGNVYTVAKLADGKCWMIENLRLNDDHTTSAVDIIKAQGYYTYPGSGNNNGSFIGLASSEDANFTNSTTANSLYSTNGSTTVNIDSYRYPAYRIPRYNKNNTNMASNATNSAGITLIDSHDASNDHVRWFGYGNYYNWPAAMASTNHYDDYNSGSEVDGTSLCPSGWELPLGRNSSGDIAQGASDTANRVGSFSYLDRMMGGTGSSQTSTAGSTQSDKWRSFPNNFVYSGAFYNATAGNRGSYSYYWTRSSNNNGAAYSLYTVGSNFYPGVSTQDKSYGSTIRCIAQ